MAIESGSPDQSQDIGEPAPRSAGSVLRPEQLTKLAAALALAAYVLGLLTVALYLYQKDVAIPDLTAFRLRFAYDGAIVVACIAVGGFVVYLAVAAADGKGGIGAAIGFFLALALFEWGGYAIVLQTDTSVVTGSVAWIALKALMAATAAGVCALLLGKALRVSTHTFALSGLAFVVFAGCLLWFITIFSRSFFPLIPAQYGGAKPEQAQLLFTAESVEGAKQIGIEFDTSSRLSKPVTVIFKGDQFYALQLPSGRVVQLDTESVVGAVTDSKRPHGADVQTRNNGRSPGEPEAGDQLLLQFSERIDPATIIRGWRGEAIPISLGVGSPKDKSHDEVTMWDAQHRDRLPLGTVEVRFRAASTLAVRQFFPATMSENGAEVVITLKAPIRLTNPRVTAALVWIPSSEPTDLAGNHSLTRVVEESGSIDRGIGDREF